MEKEECLRILDLSGVQLTEENIKNAFKKKAKIFHPDINKSIDATIVFQKINAAYSILLSSIQKEDIEEKFNKEYFANLAQKIKIFSVKEPLTCYCCHKIINFSDSKQYSFYYSKKNNMEIKNYCFECLDAEKKKVIFYPFFKLKAWRLFLPQNYLIYIIKNFFKKEKIDFSQYFYQAQYFINHEDYENACRVLNAIKKISINSFYIEEYLKAGVIKSNIEFIVFYQSYSRYLKLIEIEKEKSILDIKKRYYKLISFFIFCMLTIPFCFIIYILIKVFF